MRGITPAVSGAPTTWVSSPSHSSTADVLSNCPTTGPALWTFGVVLWLKQWRHGLKSRWGRKLHFSNRCDKFLTKFQRTAANFQQRRLWVLKISVLPLNFSKLWVFSSQLLDENFLTIFDSQKCFFSGRRAALNYLFATMPLGSTMPVGDFTLGLRFLLRLTLSLNFGLSTYLSEKVKWFCWAKTWRLTWIVTSAKEVMFLSDFVCLSVCLCVSKITQKVMDRSFWNFEDMSGMAQTTSDSILGVIREESWILDHWNFRYHCFQCGIRETAAKPNMVLPPSERHCLGGGVRALTAF